jgi:hypothetical protein
MLSRKKRVNQSMGNNKVFENCSNKKIHNTKFPIFRNWLKKVLNLCQKAIFVITLIFLSGYLINQAILQYEVRFLSPPSGPRLTLKHSNSTHVYNLLCEGPQTKYTSERKKFNWLIKMCNILSLRKVLLILNGAGSISIQHHRLLKEVTSKKLIIKHFFISWQYLQMKRFSSSVLTLYFFPIQLATKFRTCTFDRPGRMFTFPLPSRTPDQVATDLLRDLTSIIDYMYISILITHIFFLWFLCLKRQKSMFFFHFRGNESRVVLIGHSLGANIAAVYALTVRILNNFFYLWTECRSEMT